MADRSDLAQRLIDAASDAFDVGTFNYEAQVAAVLRCLAEEELREMRIVDEAMQDAGVTPDRWLELMQVRADYYEASSRLLGLADSVERVSP